MSNLQIYRDRDLDEVGHNGDAREESGGGTEGESSKVVVYLHTRDYIPYDGAEGDGLRRTTTFFSTFPPDELFMMLTSSFHQN